MNVDTGEFRALREQAGRAEASWSPDVKRIVRIAARQHEQGDGTAPASQGRPSGSRARTWERGFAEAMRRMYWALDSRGQLWEAEELRAAEDGAMGAATMFGFLRQEAGELAAYAHGMWALHYNGDDRPPLHPRSIVSIDWDLSAAPREP